MVKKHDLARGNQVPQVRNKITQINSLRYNRSTLGKTATLGQEIKNLHFNIACHKHQKKREKEVKKHVTFQLLYIKFKDYSP